MSVEWPDNLLATTIKTLSQIRKERVEETAVAVLPEEVLEFCKNYWMVEMRARLNNEDGPYVVNSEEAVEDKVLLRFAKQKKNKKKATKHFFTQPEKPNTAFAVMENESQPITQEN